MRIYKYPLGAGITTHSIPLGSVILTLQVQKNTPCIWVQIPQLHASKEQRRFQMILTGQDFELNGKYIGTVQLDEGRFVAHIYELPRG